MKKTKKEEELFQEFKEMCDEQCEKKGLKKYTEEEYKEAYHNFKSFVNVIFDFSVKEMKRERRLKLSKKKYIYLEEDGSVYTCGLCRKNISGKKGVWSKEGIRCLDCQRNIEEKIIPMYVLKDKDTWWSGWQLKDEFGLHPQTVRKMIREKKLKPRLLKDKTGITYKRIFIKKENSL